MASSSFLIFKFEVIISETVLSFVFSFLTKNSPNILIALIPDFSVVEILFGADVF